MEWWYAVIIVATALVFFLLGRLAAMFSFRKQEREIRDDAVKRSRAVLGGRFSEQLAPFLPGFPYKPSEAKFLGQPTDFIVFEGLDEKKITNVAFVEVKSGKASLSPVERSLKQTVESGNVTFTEYRVPAEVTRAKE